MIISLLEEVTHEKANLKSRLSSCFCLIFLVSCGTVPSIERDEQTEGQENEEVGQTIKRSGAEAIKFCDEPHPAFIRDMATRQDEKIDEPVPHVPFRDSIYGGCIVRVTDRKHDLDSDDQSKGLKNEYSRVQSFNADGTLIMVRSLDANYYAYDANSLEVLGRLPSMNDPCWSNLNPNLIYYIGDLTLMSFDLNSGEHQLIHDFSHDFSGQNIAAVWTRWEGNQSLDDRY